MLSVPLSSLQPPHHLLAVVSHGSYSARPAVAPDASTCARGKLLTRLVFERVVTNQFTPVVGMGERLQESPAPPKG